MDLAESGLHILAGTINGRGEVTSRDTDVAVLQQRPKGAHVQAGDSSAVPTQHAERLHDVTVLMQRRQNSHSFGHVVTDAPKVNEISAGAQLGAFSKRTGSCP